MRAPERAEFASLVGQHRDRFQPGDGPAIAELAQVRCALRAAQDALKRDGPTIQSASGARKRHPVLAAISALQIREHRLVIRLGLARPDVSMARQIHVAKKRADERDLMLRVSWLDHVVNGGLLAGHDDPEALEWGRIHGNDPDVIAERERWEEKNRERFPGQPRHSSKDD